MSKIETNICHEGPDVVIQIKIPLKDFVKLFNQLKNKPGSTVKQILLSPHIPGIDPTVRIKLANTEFFNNVARYKRENPKKYPFGLYDIFFIYWTEPNTSGKKMRFENEKFFDIGRRMATFKKNCKPEELNKLWAEHNLNQQRKTLFPDGKI